MAKHERRFGMLLVAALVPASLLVASCSSASPSTSAGGGGGSSSKCSGSIPVGITTGLTGPISASGILQLQVVEVAVAQANEEGGINGKCITLDSLDSQYQATQAVAAFNKLTSINHAPAVIVGGSSAVAAVAPIATQDKVVVLNTGGQGANLAGISPYVYSTIETGGYDVGALAEYLYGKGVRRLALACVQDATGKPNCEAMGKAWKAVGGVVAANVGWPDDTVDLSSQVAVTTQSKPDAVYLVGQPNDNPYFIKQLREAGSTIPVYGTTALPATTLYTVAGPNAGDLYYIAPNVNFQNPDPSLKNFLDKFDVMFGAKALGPSIDNGIFSYDGANMLFQAMRSIKGDITGSAIKEALDSSGTFNNLVTGATKFGTGNTVVKPLAIYQLHDNNGSPASTLVTTIEAS